MEFRYAIRMVRGSGGIDRKAVQDLRRDLGHYAAQVGLLLTPGDVRGDARSEAQSQGGLVMVWGGDALADKFLEAKTGVSVQMVELFEIDDRFFETVKHEGDEAAHRREVRARERELESGPRDEPAASPASTSAEAEQPTGESSGSAAALGAPEVTEPSARALPAEAVGDDEDDGEGDDGDEGETEAGAAAGAAGEVGPNGEPRRKRRRRRRGRRGRGQRPEGAPAAGAESSVAPAATGGGEAPAAAPAEASAPPPPAPPSPPGDAG